MKVQDFDDLKRQIANVNRHFYDGVYKDPWLKLVFKDAKQAFIESQQTDFMLGAFGGPKEYSGRSPTNAHPHIFITDEMWLRREKYLVAAFCLAVFPDELRAKWIRIDEAFRKSIVKASRDRCHKRFAMDEIIDYPDPEKV